MPTNELCGFDGLVDNDDSTTDVSGYHVLGAGPRQASKSDASKSRPSGGGGGGAGHFNRTGTGPVPSKGPVRGAPPAQRMAPSAAAKKHPYYAAGFAKRAAKRATIAALRAQKRSRREFKPITAVKGVFGDGVVIGVAGKPVLASKQPLTPKQTAAVKKYNESVAKVAKKAADAKKAGDKAMSVAKRVAADVQNASGVVKAMMAKQTKMKGFDVGDVEVFGLERPSLDDVLETGYQEIVGDEIYVHGFDPKKFNDYSDVLGAALPDAPDARGWEKRDDALAHEEALLKAAREAEMSARRKGHAAVADSTGGCACPACGARLALVLAPPPAKRPGKTAGAVVAMPGRRSGSVLGATAASPAAVKLRVKPALRASTAGSCLCACPNCGTALCLSIGPQGYAAPTVKKSLPNTYAAVAQAVHGCCDVLGIEDIDVFGDECLEIFGDESIEVFGLDAYGNPPGAEGYDPTSDPASGQYDPSADGYQEPAPEPEPVQKPIIPLDQGVKKVPEDAVIYTGVEKGWPRGAFGSYKYFQSTSNKGETNPLTGTTVNVPGEGVKGYIWGWGGMNAPNSPDPKRWILRLGCDIFGTASWHDTKQGIDPVNPPGSQSVAEGYGPLIGNPSSDFKNLRYATESGAWFWYLEEAPEWATAEVRYAAAKLLEAQRAAEKAALDAKAAAKAKADAENQAAIDQQNAANALAESAEQSRAAIEASQQAGQQAQMEIDERKAAADQARADMEAQRAEQQALIEQMKFEQQALQAQMELDKQAAQIDLQRQQAQAAYEAANPQQFYRQPGYPQPQEQSAHDDRGFQEASFEEGSEGDGMFQDGISDDGSMPYDGSMDDSL